MKKGTYFSIIMASFLLFHACTQRSEPLSLIKYRDQLTAIRNDFGGIKKLPKVKFFLFGMGNRKKYLFKNGSILTAPTGQSVFKFENVNNIQIIPNIYTVEVNLKNGTKSRIYENENGVFLEHQGQQKLLEGTTHHINLPDFKGHKYSEILKVLHHEILINILNSKPVPNFFVYSKPWRRDAAMMAMCLVKTGNIDLIKGWVLGLKEPYDQNNKERGKPENEPDNLGQTLFLLSFFADSSNPLVGQIMQEAKKIEKTGKKGTYIVGRTDFQKLPVYQTKWLKYGLASLGMADPYTIPLIQDNYSSLFWWDYKDYHVKSVESLDSNWYPYIGWARDHFYRRKSSPISNRDYPLTWEKGASQAHYPGMKVIDPAYVRQYIAAPHTWHSAEVFLYLLDL